MTSLIFCSNISRGVYKYFKGAQYTSFIDNLSVSSTVPVYSAYNLGGGDIETRAKNLSRLVDKIMEENMLSSCHLIGYSLAGLDARLVAQNNDAVRSVTTVGTPNRFKNQQQFEIRGSALADYYLGQKIGKEFVDPICNFAIGVDPKYFEEVNSENIKQFNLIFPNKKDVEYFSISSQIYHKFASDLFRYTTHYIETNHVQNVPYSNDGVNLEEQAHWGTHLMTCEADHSNLVGLQSQIVAKSTASTIIKNVQHQHKMAQNLFQT